MLTYRRETALQGAL